LRPFSPLNFCPDGFDVGRRPHLGGAITVRLSLFSRLFSRNKPQPIAATATGVPLRTRVENGGGTTLHSTALPARPRVGADAASATEPARRLPPLPVDTQAMVASADTAAASQKPPLAFVPVKPAVREAHDHREDEVVRATKMAPQEELSIKITEGLKNLSTVLGAIDQKLAAQSRTTELVAERLQALPRVLEGLVDAERNNLETLQALRGSIDRQTEASQLSSEKLDKIPGAVDGLGSKIQQQTEASAAVKTSVESVSQSVRGLVDGTQRAQNSLITEFRRGQDEQRKRLEDLVDRQRRTTLVVAGIGIVVVVGLIIVLTRIPGSIGVATVRCRSKTCYRIARGGIEPSSVRSRGMLWRFCGALLRCRVGEESQDAAIEDRRPRRGRGGRARSRARRPTDDRPRRTRRSRSRRQRLLAPPL
jgi:hypothetical protein